MKKSVLVWFLIWLIQCKSQAIKNNGHRFYTVSYDYEDPQENDRPEPEREVQFSRRADVRLPAVIRRYSNEENAENYPILIKQQSDPGENYPLQLTQIPKSQYNRFRINKKPVAIEQYLKEVPPTTKTMYNLRYSGQTRSNNHKQSLEESKSVLKQSPFQYVLQPDFEQTSNPQEAAQVVYHKPQEVRVPQNLEVQTPNLVAHQRALLAQQNALYEQQRFINSGVDSNDSSRSAIYVSQKIPKKPVVRKLNKAKVAPASETDDDYYARLQAYQQQQQQEQKPVFEPKEAAPPRFQARIPSETQYEEEQSQQTAKFQEPVQYQQLQPQTIRFVKPPKHIQPTYHHQPRPIGRYQQAVVVHHIPQEEQQQQIPRFRYQVQKPREESNSNESYQQPNENDEAAYHKITEEALSKYRAALARYQESMKNREVDPTPRPQQPQHLVYRQQESPQQEYQQQPQYDEVPEEQQPEKIYKAAELEQALRNRAPPARGPSPLGYRENLKNVRYYKNLGRPTIVYTSTTE